MNKTFISKRTNFSYGWVVVGASALLMSGVFGTLACFGVFLKPLIEEFGWTRAMTSGAMSIAQAIYGLVAIMMGRLTDKYGARMLLVFGALSGGLGYLLMSHVSSIWQLYVYFGVCIGVCMGSSWTPISTTVSKWFVEKRVLALGITTIGSAVGYMLLPPIIAHVIAGYGWRLAYLILAIVVCITSILAVILLGRNPPQGIRAVHGGRTNRDNLEGEVGEAIQPREWLAKEASRTAPFWMLMIISFVNSTVFYFVSVHIVAYATDVGIPVTSAALIFTFINGVSIAGLLLAWPITARLGNRVTLLLLLAIQAVALFLFIWAVSLWVFFTLAALFGFGFGAIIPIRTAMIPQLFGMRSVGTIIGLTAFAWALGGMTGPVLAAYIFDLSQSYDIAFLAGGLLIILGMLAVYYLDGRSA
jgi:MFS family permease